MAQNYAVGIPHDKNSEDLQGYPSPIKAKARSANENATVSSVITLTEDTTVVEVIAGTTPVAIRWVPTTETAAVTPFASVITAVGTTSNFDLVIPAGTFRRMVVPIETATTNPQSIQGVNRLNGLYQRIAVKSFAVGSVLTTEF